MHAYTSLSQLSTTDLITSSSYLAVLDTFITEGEDHSLHDMVHVTGMFVCHNHASTVSAWLLLLHSIQGSLNFTEKISIIS